MSRVKIVHVIDGSNHNSLLYNSIKYSNREVFEYSVISLEPGNCLRDQIANLNVSSFSLNYRSRKEIPSSIYELTRHFRRESPEIVQTHLFNASLIGLTAAKLVGVPVRIFTGHHSHETPLYERKLLSLVDGSSGRWLATHTIAPSRQMKEIFVDKLRLPEHRVHVLHHGFDLQDWRAAAETDGDIRAELGLWNKTVFGAVGRLFWVKNFEKLIRGFAAATAGDDSLVLMIVGAGDASQLIELAKQVGAEKKVIFTGRREDIARVMSCFDVFVHTALAESFGMVFIEAMALGKPVVSTPVGIAADVLADGRAGILADGFDETAIAAAIGKMVESRGKWADMGSTASQLADDFDIRKTQRLCDRMYLEWVKRG